jgi:pimeloyl-ACP methyl ester carboxylesterase
LVPLFALCYIALVFVRSTSRQESHKKPFIEGLDYWSRHGHEFNCRALGVKAQEAGVKQSPAAKVQLGRFLRMVLPAVLILLLGATALLGVLVYKISHPDAIPEAVSPAFYLLPFLEIPISTQDGKELPGWWIPGLKGAPGIILAPGYGMNRADGLSLAAVLHESGFNLLLYDQRGNGMQKDASTLGLKEAGDMLQALKLVQARPESDPTKLGIWGVDVGAYSALRAAADCKEVRALVADSTYEFVADFLAYRISEDFGLDNRIVHLSSFQIFRLAHLADKQHTNKGLPLEQISDRALLFIKGENRPGLADFTTAIYDKVQPQKELISFKAARTHMMSGEDLRSYDRQVASFFRLNLQ